MPEDLLDPGVAADDVPCRRLSEQDADRHRLQDRTLAGLARPERVLRSLTGGDVVEQHRDLPRAGLTEGIGVDIEPPVSQRARHKLETLGDAAARDAVVDLEPVLLMASGEVPHPLTVDVPEA